MCVVCMSYKKKKKEKKKNKSSTDSTLTMTKSLGSLTGQKKTPLKGGLCASLKKQALSPGMGPGVVGACGFMTATGHFI